MSRCHFNGRQVELIGHEFEMGWMIALLGEDKVDGCPLQAFQQRGQLVPFLAIRFFWNVNGRAGHRFLFPDFSRPQVNNNRFACKRVCHSFCEIDFLRQRLGRFWKPCVQTCE